MGLAGHASRDRELGNSADRGAFAAAGAAADGALASAVTVPSMSAGPASVQCMIDKVGAGR
jgi:hypothetical protein